MQSFLVTGGTGTLGRAVVRRLGETAGEAAGEREIRVLSRRPQPPGDSSRLPGAPPKPSGPGSALPAPASTSYRHLVGDLRTGEGLDAAVRGVRAIVHCATTNGKDDVLATRNLIDAARRAGSGPHLVCISVVGCDVIPLAYYRAKLMAERLIMDSGLPWSVQRATQFHDLVASTFAYQRWLPVTLVLKGFRFQPVDVRDVAERLADLAVGEPAGRVPDFGGPQVRDMRELAATYDKAYGRRRRIVSLRMPGGIARGFASGANLVPRGSLGLAPQADPAPQGSVGTRTFDDFVAQAAAAARARTQGGGK
jgi:uncharacterized protein YbjT (DUF2867 family)